MKPDRPAAPAPIRFRGSPPRIDALVPRRYEDVRRITVSARIDKVAQAEDTPFKVQPTPAGPENTRLRLPLPRSTPVGTYEGTLRVGDEDHAIEVRVDAQPALSFSPTHLTLLATPGGSDELTLAVVNRGNVSVELPGEVSLDLVHAEGIPRALNALRDEDEDAPTAKTKRTAKPAQRERVERAADELSRHMETLLLEIQEGAGELNPGELRELRVRANYPDRLTPGRSYVAAWTIANHLYIVAVHVQAPAARGRKVS